jgi:hypothetical protein
LLDDVELVTEVIPVEEPKVRVLHEFVNRRPLFNKLKGVRVATGDVNNDGFAEIAVTQDCTLKLFDPIAKEFIWDWEISNVASLGTPGCLDGPDLETNLIGFVEFSGEPHAIINFEVDGGNKIIAVLVGLISKEIAYEAEERIVAILELPNGKPAIATFFGTETFTYTFKIIAENPGSASDEYIRNSKLLTYASQSNYSLEKKFQAEAGLQLAYDPDLYDPQNDTDIDSDGVMDILMLIQSPNEQPAGIVVRGGENMEVLWQFPFPEEHRANILKGFHGFVDADGNGEKEAIVGDNLAVTLDGTVHTIAENFVTIDVNDIDDDGFEDIIGINTVDSSIVIYGIKTSTSAEDNYKAEIHFKLFQNYPNPFNPSTTISYSVTQPGEVDLTIFNSLGQVIRRLVSETKSAGEYTIAWNGRNDAEQPVGSGPYFYQLKVGELVQTKQMLLLK